MSKKDTDNSQAPALSEQDIRDNHYLEKGVDAEGNAPDLLEEDED